MDFLFLDKKYFFPGDLIFHHSKRQKIGLLPRAKPILVAMKVNFSNQGEGKALCDSMASGTLCIDGELS